MKKLVLFSFLMVFAFSLFAQEKGDMVISGSLSWTSKSEKVKVGSQSETLKGNRDFSFIPQFHYFVGNKLSVGLGIGYSLNKEPNDNSNASNEDQLFNKTGLFIVQPMVSYYVSLGDKFYYVPRFYIGFGTGKYKEELGDDRTEDTDVSGLSAGLALINFEFKPTDRIGIMFNAGNLEYKTQTIKFDDNKYVDRTFGLGLNLGATIGFNYYF